MKDGQVDLQEIHAKISDIEELLDALEKKCGELDSGRARKRPKPAAEEAAKTKTKAQTHQAAFNKQIEYRNIGRVEGGPR